MRPLSEFDPAWPHGHVQKNGRPARVLGMIRDKKYPLIVAVPDEEGSGEGVATYTADGKSWASGSVSPCDLINAPPPKKRVQGWVNVCRGDTPFFLHRSKSAADAWRTDACVACVFIDVEEGEGLS